MSKPAQPYARAHHVAIDTILAALNAPFLAKAHCFFGGGTRIVLELGEYRESADIDFLCSNRDGYRALRSTITETSLGDIATAPLILVRNLRADQYGIRTVLSAGDEFIKFEIINEARIDLSGAVSDRLHVPALDRVSCFAEKILANDDRWRDTAVMSRDIIDIAYMVESWGVDDLIGGAQAAYRAYGTSVEVSVRAAANKLLDDKLHFKRSTDGLRIGKTATLTDGLRRIMTQDWTCVPPAGKRAR